MGGTTATGETKGTGGTTANPNTIGPNKTCGCLPSSGNYSGNPLTATLVVNDGQTYDGGCGTFVTKSLASGGLGDGSQEEEQKALLVGAVDATRRYPLGGRLVVDLRSEAWCRP